MSTVTRFEGPVRGLIASADVAARMRAFLARHGERSACRHFALSRLAVARIAAGLAVQSATMRVVLAGLERSPEDT